MSTAVIEVNLPLPGKEQDEEYLQGRAEFLSKLPRVPVGQYRHAVPSSPWLWVDLDADTSKVHYPVPYGGLNQDSEWSRYPQSLFGNWTHDHVERSGILRSTHCEACSVHSVHVFRNGTFDRSDEDDRTIRVENPRMYWDHLKTASPSEIGACALFVENMTVPVLQILGTKYNIEPFFFASLANWIPSRYQEGLKHDEDHITVVLPFIRTIQVKNQELISPTSPVGTKGYFGNPEPLGERPHPYKDVDIRAPLLLPDNKILFHDLLAIHMYRTSTTSTVISCHPNSELKNTSAKRLQSLAQRTSDSVYWSKIYERSKDPTFLFLAILWYALYAWDEVFEVLHDYINALGSDLLYSCTDDIKLTLQLRRLQAHLLYYEQLLTDFRLSVEFIKETPNPAMTVLALTEKERIDSAVLLHKEANNIISEADRLMEQRRLMSERVQNGIHLVVASLHFSNSRTMEGLLVARKVDIIAIEQITYLATIFFPACFLANVFRMKIRQFDPVTTETLAHYIAAAIGLTLFVWWLAIALRRHSPFHPPDGSILRRALWPLFFVYDLVSVATRRWYKHTGHRPTPEIPTQQAMLYFIFEEKARGECHDPA